MARKIHHVRLIPLSSYFDFFLFKTETWLSNHTPDNATIIPSYKSLGKSHETQWGDGCLLYVRKSILANLFQDAVVNTILDAVRVRSEMDNESLLVECVHHPLVVVKTIF